MLLEFLESLEFLEFHKLPHIPQATTTDQHETGGVIRKNNTTNELHTVCSTSYRTFHKLPRLNSMRQGVITKTTPTIRVHTEHSTNNHTFHKLPRLSSNDEAAY